MTTGARPTNSDWLALTIEDAIEPDLPICDAHHHLWDHRANGPSETVPLYLMDELQDDLGSGHNVASTVFLECHSMYRSGGPEPFRSVGETEFVNGIAAMSASGLYGKTRVAAGIVGTAPLWLGDEVTEVLDAHIAAGGGRFRGIRVLTAHDPGVPAIRANPPPGLMSRDDFRAGFAHLASRQLTFDAWVYHRQIPEVVALARTFPDTTIILNHLGTPAGIGSYAGKRDEVYAEWCSKMLELSLCPNVVVKLGGTNIVVTGLGWHEHERPPSSRELVDATRHYYEFAIENFGAERCMFESNFPAEKISCSYTVLWNAFKLMTETCSSSEKAKLFRDTAERVYRLND
jgi:predicted TIM-barrel fold metal-dependent hydrolase